MSRLAARLADTPASAARPRYHAGSGRHGVAVSRSRRSCRSPAAIQPARAAMPMTTNAASQGSQANRVRSGGRIDGRRGRVDPPALHEWQQQRRAEDAVPRAQAQARIGHAQEREYRAGHGNQQERLERPASEVADDERQAHDAPPFLRIARRSSSRSFLVTCLFSIRCSISGLAEPPNMRSRNSFTIARITACRLLADS